MEVSFNTTLQQPCMSPSCSIKLYSGLKPQSASLTKGVGTSLVRLHSSPSYGFLPLRQNVTLNSRIFYSRSSSSSAYGAHLVASTIRFGSSHVKSPLFNAPNQLTRSLGFGADFFLSKAAGSSAIASTNPNLEDFPITVIALPLPQKPLLPGFCMQLYVKDPKVLAALQERKKSEAPYAAAFLLKHQGPSSSNTENIVEKWNINGQSKRKKIQLLKRIHEVGTLAQISSIQGDKVILIGLRRLLMIELVSEEPLTFRVDHLKLQDKPYDKEGDVVKATSFKVNSTLRDVLKTNSLWRAQIQTYTQPIGGFTYQHLANFGAGISGADRDKLQELLIELDVLKRLELTLELMENQLELNKNRVLDFLEMGVLSIKVLYQLMMVTVPTQELGLETDNETYIESTSSDKFRERINANKDKIPKHVLKVIEEEIIKLKMIDRESRCYDVAYNYLDWLTVLPWGKFRNDNFDVLWAEKILDEDHYGLSDVKERILEFIAVGRLRGTSQGKIICLSGPPGVGKTSIARSIARALDRKFFRFSVGGLSDVDEIKGLRRSYVGAMPGKMVQCLKSVGTSNPLVLIDEIDKIGRGYKGNPASALLEVMDPAQNANFLDLYLDVTIDLSKVLFVCTANEINEISGPLLDRMEVINLEGYVDDEKMHIARDYLVKTTCRDCGIKPQQAVLSDAALLPLIENYCREAGVRNLKNHIDKIYRKIALKLVRESEYSETPTFSVDVNDTVSLAETDLEFKRMTLTCIMKLLGSTTQDISTESKTKQIGGVAKTIVIDESNLADYVGKPVFSTEKIYEQTPVGVVMGLAWTSLGGSILYIETTFVEEGKGKGGLRTTGQLGEVMKESAEIAHTVAKRIMLEKEPENPFFANFKLHLHVPEGGTPKDGSAGCTMVTSLLSLAMKKPVRKDLAMTGVVTLTGRILPVGGVMEKTMAAVRNKVKTIIFPKANQTDFDELTENVKKGLDVHFVDEYEQIFELAFNYDH